MPPNAQCPQCQRIFRLSESFAADRVLCPHCQSVVPVAPLAAVAASDADTFDPAVFPEVPGPHTPKPPPPATPPPPQVTAAPPAPAPMFTAYSFTITAAFARDFIRLLVPFRSVGELFTFLFAAVMAFGIYWVKFACCGFLLQIIIAGFLCSFLFNIMFTTAAGEFHLPDIGSLFDALTDFRNEILSPLWKFLSAVLYVLIPAFVAAFAYTLITGPMASDSLPFSINLTLWLLIALGSFFWPMVILIRAFDAPYFLLRPDLIFKSILQIAAPYLLCWFILLNTAALWYLAYHYSPLVLQRFFTPATHILYYILLFLTGMYLTLFAMRLTGLLYHHHESHLLWS